MQSIQFEHLSPTAVQVILDQLLVRIKQVFIDRTVEIDYPVEAVVGMALAGYLDREAIAFVDCKPQRGKA